MFKYNIRMYGGRKIVGKQEKKQTKYTEDDLVPGPKDLDGAGKRLNSGALAGYVETPQGLRWRIVEGPGPSDMDKLAEARKRRGKKEISLRAAKRAFNRYYNEKNVGQGKVFKSSRGLKQSRTYDLNHASPRRTNSSYRRSPHKFDYPGLDDGPKTRKTRAPTAKQLAALAAGRAKRASKRGGGRYY